MTSFDFQPESVQTGGGAAAAGGGFGGLGGVGFGLSLAGMMLGAVGSFYQVKSQRNQLESQALSADFDASMSQLNARAAETDAQRILEAGQRESGMLSLRYGQQKASQAAAQGASGAQIGVGSAAEVQASTELAKRIDMQTIDVRSIQAAEAQRTRAVDFQNQSMMASVSARNLRSTKRSLNPWLAGATSLLGSGGQVAQQWVAVQQAGGRYR